MGLERIHRAERFMRLGGESIGLEEIYRAEGFVGLERIHRAEGS